MTNNSIIKSNKGKPKIPYDPNEYPKSVNDFVSTAKATCAHLGGKFHNAWMDEIHIQLDYTFEPPPIVPTSQPRRSERVKANTREEKLTHVTINHPKDKSQVTAIHLQGIAAKDDPAYTRLKNDIDHLRAQIKTKVRALEISAIKQPGYIHRDQVKWLLLGAGATDVEFVTIDFENAYGVKVQGKYNGVAFCVLVYHQFNGALNQNPVKRCAVWEKPVEDNPQIELLRRTLDAGIESNKLLQRKAASLISKVDLRAEKLSAKIGQISLVK